MIPTKEQFIELNNALTSSIEFIQKRFNYRQPYPPIERAALSEIFSKINLINTTEDEIKVSIKLELQKFIKPDVELYLEQSEANQSLPAWRWLHSQQNFIRAKERIFNHWPSDEQLGNGLANYIAKSAVNCFLMQLEKREALIAAGVTPSKENAEMLFEERLATRLVNSSPLDVFQSALYRIVRTGFTYRKWVAGVALALSDYHYGESAEMVVNRKNRVEALILAWESFGEQVALAQSDVEIGEYLSRTVKRVLEDKELMVLNALHQNGALYFIGRNDETVTERLFIREVVLLNRRLYGKPYTNVIADLFYLDGMKSAPTERAIQRIAKSAIVNKSELEKIEFKIDNEWKQKWRDDRKLKETTQ